MTKLFMMGLVLSTTICFGGAQYHWAGFSKASLLRQLDQTLENVSSEAVQGAQESFEPCAFPFVRTKDGLRVSRTPVAPEDLQDGALYTVYTNQSHIWLACAMYCAHKKEFVDTCHFCIKTSWFTGVAERIPVFRGVPLTYLPLAGNKLIHARHDGSIWTEYPNGMEICEYPNGTKVTRWKNGNRKWEYANGTNALYAKDGSLLEDNGGTPTEIVTDEGVERYYPDGEKHKKLYDGTIIFYERNGKESHRQADLVCRHIKTRLAFERKRNRSESM